MGKIGFPQHVIDANVIAQLDTNRLKPEIDIDLPTK